MTKEQAIKAAEKLLIHIYDGECEIVSRICTASLSADATYLYHALDEVERFIEDVKKGLKQ